MIKSILKKVLVLIIASSSVVSIISNQFCNASCKKDLEFCSISDKEIFIEAYNIMLSCAESSEPYKDNFCEFTISDYNVFKDYILYTDDYDIKEKEHIILTCIRTILKTKKSISKNFANEISLELKSDDELKFDSYEDKILFFDSYNIMCFFEDQEIFAIFMQDKISIQDLIDLKEFYINNNIFYTKEKINKILKMVDRTISCNNNSNL